MKKTISQDLQALAEIVQEFNVRLGIDPEQATKQTAELVKAIGKEFHGQRMYISYDHEQIKKIKIVNELASQGLTIGQISKKTMLHPSRVYRMLN